MQKANGLGSRIDNAISKMKAEYKNNCSMSKKELHDFAVEVAGGSMSVTKVADRAIWAAVYQIWSKVSVDYEDNRGYSSEEYR